MKLHDGAVPFLLEQKSRTRRVETGSALSFAEMQRIASIFIASYCTTAQ